MQDNPQSKAEFKAYLAARYHSGLVDFLMSGYGYPKKIDRGDIFGSLQMNNSLPVDHKYKFLHFAMLTDCLSKHCFEAFDMDSDGKISVNDLLKYAMRLKDTDIYLKNDVMKLIQQFENKQALDSKVSKYQPFLSANYNSKLHKFAEGYKMRTSS